MRAGQGVNTSDLWMGAIKHGLNFAVLEAGARELRSFNYLTSSADGLQARDVGSVRREFGFDGIDDVSSYNP